MVGAPAARDAGWGSVAFVCLVEFAAAVGALLDPDASVLNVTVFLTFTTPYGNTNILSDCDKMVVNSDATCK